MFDRFTGQCGQGLCNPFFLTFLLSIILTNGNNEKLLMMLTLSREKAGRKRMKQLLLPVWHTEVHNLRGGFQLQGTKALGTYASAAIFKSHSLFCWTDQREGRDVSTWCTSSPDAFLHAKIQFTASVICACTTAAWNALPMPQLNH